MATRIHPAQAQRSGPAPLVALIGFMGAGKSTVGRLLARALGVRFLDLDAYIERRWRTSIHEVFRVQGEGRFREMESEALRSVARSARARQGLVLATGGGAPAQSSNRSFFLHEARTFWLDVSFQEFQRRTGGDSARPLLALGSGELARLYHSRQSVYQSLGARVRTDGLEPEEVRDRILAELRRTPSSP